MGREPSAKCLRVLLCVSQRGHVVVQHRDTQACSGVKPFCSRVAASVEITFRMTMRVTSTDLEQRCHRAPVTFRALTTSWLWCSLCGLCFGVSVLPSAAPVITGVHHSCTGLGMCAQECVMPFHIQPLHDWISPHPSCLCRAVQPLKD